MNLPANLPIPPANLSPERVAERGPKGDQSSSILARPEMFLFAGLLVVFSGSVIIGTTWRAMMFHPAAVAAGEWWRLLTHPFVHVTWYHLLLDASAFFLLYHGLLEARTTRRLLYVVACGCGSLLLSWLASPAIATGGLCGLSGIAHGLMAVSAAELLKAHDRNSTEWRIGVFTLAIVVGKAACEAISGHILFGFLYFGMVGEPVAVCHAGGVVGGLTAWLLFRLSSRSTGAHGYDTNDAIRRSGL